MAKYEFWKRERQKLSLNIKDSNQRARINIQEASKHKFNHAGPLNLLDDCRAFSAGENMP